MARNHPGFHLGTNLVRDLHLPDMLCRRQIGVSGEQGKVSSYNSHSTKIKKGHRLVDQTWHEGERSQD
jgi:hypothetical protein